MEIALTWDLFVIVFFAMVITYSFIIGKQESVKVVIASYIAAVSVQGIGNILGQFSGQSLNVMGISVDITLLSGTKLLLFVAAVIFLAVRGGIDIAYSKPSGSLTSMVITGAFGFATAGLLLSTLLTYVAGTPILDTELVKAAAVSPILEESRLMHAMVLYQNLWFSLPAILLVAVGFVSNE
jgi:hypothetical protein